MSALNAIWKNGQVVLEGRADWSEGCRLIVQEARVPSFEFMSEAEQGDDAASIQRWIDDLRTIPPVPSPDPSEEADWRAWEQTMRLHNVEAVRRQFAEDGP